MNFDLIPVFLFLSFAIVLLIVIISITFFQQVQSNKLLRQLSSEKLKHSRIRFFQIHSSKFVIRGGLSIKAEMYYNEELILICPKKSGWFNGLFNMNLPMILTNDIKRIDDLTRHYNIYKPDKLKFTKWNDLVIDYQSWMFTKVNYNITIEFLNKSDLAVLPNFKMVTETG